MSIPIIPEKASPVGERPVAGGGGVPVLAAAPPPCPAPSHRERGGSAGVVTQPLGRHLGEKISVHRQKIFVSPHLLLPRLARLGPGHAVPVLHLEAVVDVALATCTD